MDRGSSDQEGVLEMSLDMESLDIPLLHYKKYISNKYQKYQHSPVAQQWNIWYTGEEVYRC